MKHTQDPVKTPRVWQEMPSAGRPSRCVSKENTVQVGSSDHVQTREVSRREDVTRGPRAHRQGYLNVFALFIETSSPLLNVESRVISHCHQAMAF